jgi:hypothetical protein
MAIQRCILGTVVGGVVLFFVGFLIYGILFVDFFEANSGTAVGVMKDSPNFMALAGGQLLWGGALTLALGWKGASGVADGLRVGASLGVLFFLGIDLTLYATTNMSNLTGTLADAALATALFAVTGAVIVAVVGRKAP